MTPVFWHSEMFDCALFLGNSLVAFQNTSNWQSQDISALPKKEKKKQMSLVILVCTFPVWALKKRGNLFFAFSGLISL